MEVKERYERAGLLKLAALYEFAAEAGLQDIGSSSIDPSFTTAVEEVKAVLANRGGVFPRNARTAALWAALGDPSATFYFSGFRTVDGKTTIVATPLFLEILSDHLNDITLASLEKIDVLAGAFNIGKFQDLEVVEVED